MTEDPRSSRVAVCQHLGHLLCVKGIHNVRFDHRHNSAEHSRDAPNLSGHVKWSTACKVVEVANATK